MATAHGTYSWKQRAVLGTCPWAMAQAMRSLARSWRIRSSIPEGVDPSNTARPLIYALWHETVITIIGHWRDHAIQGLASQSFDGELIASVMTHLGYPVVSRGSSSRGGAGALMSHAQALREGRHVAITVDGPRGPAYRAKPGILRVARESGVSIVPTACVASPDWRLRSWDRARCLRLLPGLRSPWENPWAAATWKGKGLWSVCTRPWAGPGTKPRRF